MLSPETNATTNATAEEKMPGGRVTKWVKKNDKFLLGAATGGRVGGAIAAAAAATTGPLGNGIDPAILEHAQENAVTIKAYAVDAMGNNPQYLGVGTGSFIAGTDGRLIGTAAHVVSDDLPEGAKQIVLIVTTSDGEKFLVKAPGKSAIDADNDVAIVDLGQTTNYTGMKFAPAGSAELGEEMWTVGPEGVKQFHIGSLKPDGRTGTEDVLRLDGVAHEGESGRFLIDTDGRVVGIKVSGTRKYPVKDGKPLYDKNGDGKPDFDDDLTISYATKSERLKELSEDYQANPGFKDYQAMPEFLSGRDVSVAPKSLFSGDVGEVNVAKLAGSSPDDGGVSDIVPVMADPSGGTGPWSPGFSPDDGGVLKNFLVIGDQSSVIGPWPPLGSSDDGGAIDSLLEALDALN